MAESEHHEADELDLAAGDFWVQIESSSGAGPIWDRSLNLSTSGNVANGTILTTLLFAYIGYHERLLAHHQCSNRTVDWSGSTSNCLACSKPRLIRRRSSWKAVMRSRNPMRRKTKLNKPSAWLK